MISCLKFGTNLLPARKWLLVYDGLTDLTLIASLMPRSSGSIIITTRCHINSLHMPQPCHVMRLEGLRPYDSLELFVSLCGHSPGSSSDQERESMITLMSELNGIPLGIQQVAMYMCDRRYNGDDYTLWYKRFAHRIFVAKPKYSISPHNLNSVWEMEFDSIIGTNAYMLLGLLSMLGPVESWNIALGPSKLNIHPPLTSFFDDGIEWVTSSTTRKKFTDN
jgi:hypothetical protein